MTRLTQLAAGALLAVALQTPAMAQTAAAPVELAGVKYEPAVTVGNQRLTLNGAGIRYKAIFKVYTAGLYLNAKAATPEQVLANNGPRRIHVVMLRAIDGAELGKLFTRGMEDNATRDEFYKSVGGIMKMSDIFSTKKKLVPGEHFSVDWVPGVGTTVLVNGKPAAEPIKEPEFFSSLLKIWLGKSPADSQLKEALLGRQSTANSGNDDPNKF
jgi:hypothetical protein